MVPWRLGEYAAPPNTPVHMSILLIHHREDRYPDPFAFRPERWEAANPAPRTGFRSAAASAAASAPLAMAEQRVVLETLARRLDLVADDPEPEHALHSNVTMIRSRGAGVVVRSRLG
jgi:cytochrome P450